MNEEVLFIASHPNANENSMVEWCKYMDSLNAHEVEAMFNQYIINQQIKSESEMK